MGFTFLNGPAVGALWRIEHFIGWDFIGIFTLDVGSSQIKDLSKFFELECIEKLHRPLRGF